MIEKDMGAGGHWYVVARSFPTSLMAKAAWERAERKLDMSRGDEGIGVLRVAPNPRAGTLESGLGQVHGVVCVTLDKTTALKAERIIAGNEWTPTPDFIEAVIYRRARVMTTAGGQRGRLRIRRPEGQGAEMDPLGRMHERRHEG